MPKEAIYTAILKHNDGSEIKMSIPGTTDEDGSVWVPETITIDTGQTFKLDKAKDTHFEYTESYKPKIPFSLGLH